MVDTPHSPHVGHWQRRALTVPRRARPTFCRPLWLRRTCPTFIFVRRQALRPPGSLGRSAHSCSTQWRPLCPPLTRWPLLTLGQRCFTSCRVSLGASANPPSGILVSTHPKTAASSSEDSRFFFVGTSMLAARLEVDKWEPLLTKLTLYETVGGEEENGLVWMPVYQALRRYVLARERTLHEVADERQTVALSSPVHTLDAAAIKTEVGGHSSMTGTTPGSFPDVVPNVSAPRHGRSSTGLDHRQTLDNKEGAWASTGQSSTESVDLVNAAPTDKTEDSVCAHTSSDHPEHSVAQTGPRAPSASGAHGEKDPSVDNASTAYDRDLLTQKIQCLRQASADMDAFCRGLLLPAGSQTLTHDERSPSLHSAGYGARVAMALDASSVEIEKQMKASDESSSLDGPVGEELVADSKAPAP